MTTGRRPFLLAGLAAPFIAREGFAQGDWPKGPIRWVVAFAAGGAADTVARNIALRVSEIVGQQVIIDNRTGGNAVVAANAVLQAPRDGQTFLVDAANQITNPLLIKDLPFDYQQTWIPVTQLSSFPQVVAVKHDFAAKTIQEYIAEAKAKPGTISYGTPPAAGMGQMAGEELQRRAGIKLIHAPYRGGADAARDIGAGAIDSVIITTSSIRPPLAAGRVRILAVTSLKRTAAFPDVPTLAESGYPGFDLNDWNGLFAVTGTPSALIDRMQAVVAEAIKDPKVRERLDPSGAELVASTPAGFKTWLDGQRTLLTGLIKDAGIKLQ
ncbi:MAG: twin-arginine translocation pathway signal protein [Reyranella sp.]|jgi:tripartite-type tricarboxylate transporter receptor subunit TctC|uniref:Bug family tripartite tricarboxylate transporter substrate binding protein n=1 Tax=Reyranella sp. TaxID=1929291 RepID=UPI0025E5D77B|nr:tripartite tricarboxylate transporter substrate-binding protein [Reyranella sp.]MBR2815373.1 twin-arginine translocation pathway signal protein [Reyranella sp.]